MGLGLERDGNWFRTSKIGYSDWPQLLCSVLVSRKVKVELMKESDTNRPYPQRQQNRKITCTTRLKAVFSFTDKYEKEGTG